MHSPTVEQRFRLALQHHRAGELREAEALYSQVIADEPGHADALHCLGAIATQSGRDAAAAELFRRAIAIRPNWPEAYHNLGLALKNCGNLEDAISAYRAALALRPDYPSALFHLGLALQKFGQLDEAVVAYRRLLALQPGSADANSNLATALVALGRVDEGIAAFREAVALQPNFAMAHHNLAMALLLRGDWADGWDEYEWRWKWNQFTSPPRNFPQPLWNGDALAGRTILLHAEQGMGDTLQFCRYLPMVAARGGRIVVEAQQALHRLLRTMPGAFELVLPSQQYSQFDVHCPLLSLPRGFQTTLETIPREVPYLHAPLEESQFWKARVASLPPALNVGLRWAGSPTFKLDELRSPRQLSLMAPLSSAKGVRFISLQKGDGADQAKKPPAGMELHDWTEELHDFADTAALVSQLDLVISSDTAVAHLAGAMNKPVWLLLPFIPDWRWLLGREDSPWYPSMRLFRQSSPGDWGSAIGRAADELRQWVRDRGSHST